MTIYQKIEKAAFGRILGEGGFLWWWLLPAAIEAGKAIASAGETAKGPFTAPINEQEYNDLLGTQAFLEKEIAASMKGWRISSAGDLGTLNNKLTQVRSALAQWTSKKAGEAAHAKEVAAAGADIETQAVRGLKQLAESRASRGLRGAGEIMDPDVVFLSNIQNARDRLSRGEDIHQIQQDLQNAGIENQNAVMTGQAIKADNENLLNSILNLGTQAGSEFLPGGMWGGPNAAEKLLTDQNKMLLDFLGEKTTGTPDPGTMMLSLNKPMVSFYGAKPQAYNWWDYDWQGYYKNLSKRTLF